MFSGVRLALQLCPPIPDEKCGAFGFLLLGETTREALLSWRGWWATRGFCGSGCHSCPKLEVQLLGGEGKSYCLGILPLNWIKATPWVGWPPRWVGAGCMAVSSTSILSKWLVTAPLPVQGGSNFSPGTEIFSKSLKQKAQIPFLSGFKRVPEPYGVKVPLQLG